MLVPLKAIVLNLLTLCATLGVAVAAVPGPLDLTTPLLLFMFIFGLSMDYEVFLLARIKEEWDRRRDNDAAVLAGIAASGPVITVAALSIGIVFGGFALGSWPRSGRSASGWPSRSCSTSPSSAACSCRPR